MPINFIGKEKGGEGKYLMPGLADMHVHIKEENELLLFVANGVITVRDMWGTTGFQLRLGFPDQLVLRDQIAQGQLFGPKVYTAGPVMEGPPATMPLMPVFKTPEEAEKSVAWQAAEGYDLHVSTAPPRVYDRADSVSAQKRELDSTSQQTICGLQVICKLT